MAKLVIKDNNAVAGDDLDPGEIIFQQSPVVIGPGVGAKPVCLECHRPVSLTLHLG